MCASRPWLAVGVGLAVLVAAPAPARAEPTVLTQPSVAQYAQVEALQKIQAAPEFREQLVKFGMEPFAPQSPGEFAAMIAAEQPRWAKAVQDSGAKVD